MAFSGSIPLVSLGSGSLSGIAGGLINNLTSSAISVALSPRLSDQWANSLGLNPQALTNFVGTIATPGLISAGGQAISQALTSSIVNSKALGPAGPLVQNFVTGAANNLTQSLLGNIFPPTTSSPTKFFPGAGNEPEADYQGFTYNLGTNGPDVVFSLKPATTGAQAEVKDQVSGNGPGGVSTSIPAGQSVPSSSGAPASSIGDYSKAFQDTSNTFLTDLNLQAISAGSSSGIPFGSPDAFKTLSAVPLNLTFSAVGQPFSLDSSQSSVWNFICAPEEISWSTAAQVDRVPIFGTNYPPVVSGSRGMRELSMSNALVEGFTRGKTIEGKISDLENLLNFSLDTKNGYVKVPVYWIYANNKRYGDVDGGCFVIKEMKVKEEMRDLTGLSTRAKVDISFSQVPPYQVDDGRDIASKTVSGTTSSLGAVANVQRERPINIAPTTGASGRRGRQGSSVTGSANQGISPTVKIPGIPAGATNVKIDTNKKGESTVRYIFNGVERSKLLPRGTPLF